MKKRDYEITREPPRLILYDELPGIVFIEWQGEGYTITAADARALGEELFRTGCMASAASS